MLVSAWRSVLGDKDADSYLDEVDNCPLVANADQTDSDGNRIGDACGPTFAQGTVGGSVPGDARAHAGDAGDLRRVRARASPAPTTRPPPRPSSRTAGDAALTVSDPGRLTNGAFTLPEPLRVE